MFEQFNTLRSLFNQAKPELTAYLTAAEVTALEDEINQRTLNHQPIVMVYGVYNAGKSTLINALLGEEIAKVGDIPVTDKVDSYRIGDVTILDTPGIDAPIEHEKTTREQLSKSDAVIFVLNSDGVLEEQQTYIEIGNILAAGKPMLVVINNKSGYQAHDTEYISLVDKFRTNLYRHFEGDEQQLARLDKVQDFLVNAGLALKGKLNNKPKLVELSQIAPVEKAVARLFNDTDSAQVAKTLATQLQDLLTKAINIARKKADNYELQRLEELISNIDKSQKSLFEKVVSHANKGKPALKLELVTQLQNGQGEATNATIQQWQQQQVDYLEHQIQREIKHLNTEATEVAQLFLNVTNNQLSASPQSDETSEGLVNLFSVLTSKGMHLKITDDLATKGVIEVLKQGKTLLPTLFKGVGQKTMEKMAGKVVPLIGPFVDVAMAIYDYHRAAEQEQRQVSRERQQLEKMNQQAESVVIELYESLQEGVEDALQDTFNPISSRLKQSLRELSQQADGVESSINLLNTTYLQLDRF